MPTAEYYSNQLHLLVCLSFHKHFPNPASPISQKALLYQLPILYPHLRGYGHALI